jgi:hypothetical protein
MSILLDWVHQGTSHWGDVVLPGRLLVRPVRHISDYASGTLEHGSWHLGNTVARSPVSVNAMQHASSVPEPTLAHPLRRVSE